MPAKMQLTKGNEALAMGAIAGGCDCFFGYPITPQNEVPEVLSYELPKRGRVFVQAESEVASINMVYGAAAAGKRADGGGGGGRSGAHRHLCAARDG